MNGLAVIVLRVFGLILAFIGLGAFGMSFAFMPSDSSSIKSGLPIAIVGVVMMIVGVCLMFWRYPRRG